MNSFHYVLIQILPWLLKKFRVSQESFTERSQEAELEISCQSVETCNSACGLYFDDLQHQHLQQSQKSNSRSENCSRNVSILRNSDIPNSVILRKRRNRNQKCK